MKQYRKRLIITSIITILPILVGIFFWKQLPDTIATHFGSNNAADGWSSKASTVFGLPLFFLVIHLFCVCVTLNDPKKKNIGRMMLAVIFWIVPVISIVSNGSILAYALGMQIDMTMIVSIMMGILFIVLGNYMSKNQQNYTVGIKIPWTLSSEENWNKTHRIASKLWVVAGIVFIANIFLRSAEIILVVIACTVLIPVIYSFILYKRENRL